MLRSSYTIAYTVVDNLPLRRKRKTVSKSSQPFPQSLWSFMSEESLPDVSFPSHFCPQTSSDHVLDYVYGLVLVLNGSNFAIRSVQDPSSIKVILFAT